MANMLDPCPEPRIPRRNIVRSLTDALYSRWLNQTKQIAIKPGLEPDIDEAILAESFALNIQLFYVHMGGSDSRIFLQGLDGTMRPLQ